MEFNNRPELYLIKVLLNKESYDSFNSFIDKEYLKNNCRELLYLYNTLESLHQKHNKDISFDEFQLAFQTQYPDADKQIYGNLLKTLQDAQIDPAVGQGIIHQIQERRRALKLSEKAFQVAQGFAATEELQELMSNWDKVDHLDSPIKRINLDLEEMLEHVYQQQGHRWRLDCLNKSLGSLRQGDFGFIFARPESGKTTFLACEATEFARQKHTGPILWFNNEEQGEKVGVRIIQAYFGITLDQLTAKRKEYNARFTEEVGERLQLYDEALLSKADIESVIKATKPSLIIYDQIDKIRGFSNDRDDLRLGAIYQWARELAKSGHAAIGVCQADGTAEGIRYLTMEHVANAKTSKQAEADFIIGIGKQHNQDQEYIRYLNISKNKLFGDSDSRPELRHGRFEVLIRPEIARYEDVIRFD